MADSIDDILDGTLDDLKDMPEFKPFPVGLHKCIVNFETKEVAGFPGVEISLKLQETMEMSDPEAAPAAAGDETSTFYFLKHKNPKTAELGQGKLKLILMAIRDSFPGATTVRDLLKEGSGGTYVVATGVRDGKKEEGKTTKVYTDILALTVA